MIAEIKKVFFHELGHYIANRINHINFCMSPVQEIILTKHENASKVKYEGQTSFKIPKGESIITSLKHPPQKIAELVYGCYFQSLYLNVPLTLCLDWRNDKANGLKDYEGIMDVLSTCEVPTNKNKEFYNYILKKYFSRLKLHKQEFETLFKLSPSNYLIKKNDIVFQVDLKKLENATEDFIKFHTPTYLNFISEISLILGFNNQKE